MKSNLTNEFVSNRLIEKFGADIISTQTPYDLLTVEINPSKVKEVVTFLKEDPELQISFLSNIGGVHYPNETGREFAVVYHIFSLVNRFQFRLKAYIPLEIPEIDSIVDIYSGANWMERETFDFYGIIFKGHPNLTRILNEETLDYFPMRKEYHLEEAGREDKDDRFFGR